MKKIFTFFAAMLMVTSMFAATETVYEVNFAQIAVDSIKSLSAETKNFAPTFGSVVSAENVNVYSLSIPNFLDADKLYSNRNDGTKVLVRYADVNTIGLHCPGTTIFIVPGLQKNDIVEVAWNSGRKNDVYNTIDSTFSNLGNVSDTEVWGSYDFKHTSTSDNKERTFTYTTHQFKVTANDSARFDIKAPSGQNILIGYIKVTREVEDPEPEAADEDVAELDFDAIVNGLENNLYPVTKGSSLEISEISMNLISYGEETFGYRVAAASGTVQLRKHDQAQYTGLMLRGVTNIAIRGLKADDNIIIEFNKGSGQNFQFGNAIINGKNAGDAIESGNAYGVASDGDLVLKTTETGNNDVYIHKITIVKDGYYLVGNMNDWAYDATYLFTQNPNNDAEYMLQGVTFEAGAQFKVKGIFEGVETWYRDGLDNNYVVNDGGKKNIYFRPSGNSDWGDYYYVYIETPSATAVENVATAKKAVKMVENGQVVIVRDGVKYNVLGTRL